MRGLTGKTAVVTSGAGAIAGSLADHARSWIAGQATRAGIIVGLEPA